MASEADQLTEKKFLIKHSLMGAIYQNRLDKVDLRQFLNRIMLLAQKPMIIVLLEGIGKVTYTVAFHTMHDPLWKPSFEEYLKNEVGSQRGNNIILPSKLIGDNRITFQGHLHICFFSLSYAEPKAVFSLIKLGSSELPDFISPLKAEIEEHILIPKEFDKTVKKKKESWENGVLKTNNVKISLKELIDYTNKAFVEGFFNKQVELITRVFEEEYNQIKDSLLLHANPQQPPNILFALKIFDSSEYRFQRPANHSDDNPSDEYCYSYGVRGIFPDSQKKDIINSLKELRSLQQDPETRRTADSYQFYKQKLFGTKPRDAFDENKNKDDQRLKRNVLFTTPDSYFWKVIDSDSDFSEFFKILEKPYSREARSLSDLVLTGGFVRVVQSPYTTTLTNRLNNAGSKEALESDDYKRLEIYHYLMSMASKGNGDISTLLVPGSVNGAVWFTMGHYFSDDNKSTSAKHARWIDFHHYYHSVMPYFIRGIRSKAKRLYINQIAAFAHQIIGALREKHGVTFQPDRFENMFNYLCLLHCRVYPFETVQTTYYTVVNRKDYHQYSADKGLISIHNKKTGEIYLYYLNLHKNPYFDNTTGKVFLDPLSVQQKLDQLVWYEPYWEHDGQDNSLYYKMTSIDELD